MALKVLLAKGALIVVGSGLGPKTFLWFQYNPAQLTRSLKPMIAGGESGSHSEAIRVTGPPVETISLDVSFDASTTVIGPATGIAPFLAVIELLVYPTTASLVADAAKLAVGTIEIAPAPAPMVLFSWGTRLIPVAIQSYSVTEEGFDDLLNPIRATVKLEMRVLSAADLSPTNDGYKYYMFYQKSKEILSNVAVASWLNLVPR